MLIDTVKGEFRVPAEKLARFRGIAKDILCHPGRNKRFVTPKSVKCFAGVGASFYIASVFSAGLVARIPTLECLDTFAFAFNKNRYNLK